MPRSFRGVRMMNDLGPGTGHYMFKKEEGWKDDAGKVRMELIPPEAMMALGIVLTFGAVKYGDRNWEKGMGWGRVFGAAMRHLLAWWGGKGPTTVSFLFGSMDEETGYSHLWHALCCVVFLVTMEERRIGTDDRHQPVKEKTDE